MLWPNAGRSRGGLWAFRAHENRAGPFRPRPDPLGTRAFARSTCRTLLAGCLLIAVCGCQTNRMSGGSEADGHWCGGSFCPPAADKNVCPARDPHDDEAGSAVAADISPQQTARFLPVGQPGPLAEGTAGAAETASPVDQAAPTAPSGQAASKPELLPWRTRLKDRIATRLLGRQPSPSPGEVKPFHPDKSAAPEDSSTEDRSPGQSTLSVRTAG